MENNKIYLSPLDPSNDPQKWSALIKSIVARAIEVRQRRQSFGYQLYIWARPAFALAVTVAFLVVASGLLRVDRAHMQFRPQVKPTAALAVWAVTNEHPSTKAIFELFRGTDEDK